MSPLAPRTWKKTSPRQAREDSGAWPHSGTLLAMNRTFVSLGSAFAFLGVALGAFGTHGLRDRLSEANLKIWQTGVQYHLIHAVALVLVGLLAAQESGRAVRTAGWLMAVGIVIFSGSLYALAVTDVKILGAITPLGGLCFLASWLTLAVSFGRPKRAKS
jgi:uncharacterized membrane protein YgdD (TMEM256/DUF423 family)